MAQFIVHFLKLIPIAKISLEIWAHSCIKLHNIAYSFDFMELALLIVGILMLIQLSKVRGIFYYVSLTLQDLIDVLLLLVIIYVVLKIISSIVGAILLYGNEKSISSMVEETNVEQKL